jgi:4-hydroxy-3-polyprenylbenzoate decarboxylase
MSRLRKQLILAITGASGAALGIRSLELLRETGCETHLILSQAAQTTIPTETGWSLADVHALANYCYEPDDIGASIASGSFATDGMLVVPCSIKTLSAIANSYTNDLIARSADVCLKEGRRLVLGLRETPLHLGHLRIMKQAAEAGAVIFPLIPVFYAGHQTLDEMVNDLAGRLLLRLGIDNNAYFRWTGLSPDGESSGGD